MRAFALALATLVSSVAIHAQLALSPFPEPEKILKDDKQFNGNYPAGLEIPSLFAKLLMTFS